tara:strand:+ start:280 stop:1227 length:948 start_codon:yes stop_codon:yes gene_type:complete
MIYRNLGRTGLKTSILSLGTGGARRLGQDTGLGIDGQKRLVAKALEHGINTFDTSCQYGNSETILGKCLTGVDRESYILSTKWSPENVENTDKDLSKELEKSVTESLKRLRTNHIDVMLFHGITPTIYKPVVDKLYPTMIRLKEKGYLRHIGFSTKFTEDPGQDAALIALANDPEAWDVIMLKYGILNQHAEKKILPLARKYGVGVMNMAAVRVKLPDPYLLKNLIADWKARGLIAHDSLPPDNPLGWLLHDNVSSIISAGYKFAAEPESISTVLTGTATINHLEENVEALKYPELSPDDNQTLKDLFSHIVEYA